MASVALLERADDRSPWRVRGQRRGRAVRDARGRRRRRAGRRHTWRWRCAAGCCPPRTGGCSAPSPPRPPSCSSSAGSPRRPRGPARGGGQPDPDRAARRRLPRPADPAGLDQGRRQQPAPAATSPGPRRTGPSCWRRIEEGADRLDHLVGNLLDMCRLQTGTVVPHLAPVALDEVVPVALVGRPRADEVRPTCPRTCRWCWPTRACWSGSSPTSWRTRSSTARAGAARAGDRRAPSADRVELRVVDRGPGVPDEAKGRIFEPFQRSATPRGRSGVGLGPGGRPRLRRGHGRQLEAEDTPGGGLTMVLTLPPADVGRPRPAASPAEPGGARRAAGAGVTRVLVVDDEPQILRALRINLARAATTWSPPRTGARPWSSPRASTPTWWCSTSGCPTSTASR